MFTVRLGQYLPCTCTQLVEVDVYKERYRTIMFLLFLSYIQSNKSKTATEEGPREHLSLISIFILLNTGVLNRAIIAHYYF